jgi:hypothetical protein
MTTMICQYDHCREGQSLPILVTDTGQETVAKRFCGYAHAIAWLMNELQHQDDSAELAKLAAEHIEKEDQVEIVIDPNGGTAASEGPESQFYKKFSDVAGALEYWSAMGVLPSMFKRLSSGRLEVTFRPHIFKAITQPAREAKR